MPSVNIKASANSAWSSTTRTRTLRRVSGTAVSFFRRIGGGERPLRANLRQRSQDHSFEGLPARSEAARSARPSNVDPRVGVGTGAAKRRVGREPAIRRALAGDQDDGTLT